MNSDNAKEYENSMRDNTALIIAETPCNPTMRFIYIYIYIYIYIKKENEGVFFYHAWVQKEDFVQIYYLYLM